MEFFNRKNHPADESERNGRTAPNSRRVERRDKFDWSGPVLYEAVRSYVATPKIMLYQPRSMEDMPYIADQMQGMFAFLLNLEHLPQDLARRVLDTVSGIAYGMDYQMTQVSSRSYLILPQQVELICA